MKNILLHISFLIFMLGCLPGNAQVSYGAAAAYSFHKIVPTYTGSLIRVLRTCDNATVDIGFDACGDLDTAALKTFVVAANPLSAITVTSATAFSLRRLRCTYAGSAIRVRTSAVGSATLDIGFTANGDLDTAALKSFIGSNSAFITTWYDQSGNGRNASQATAGSQPRIVNAGVIERQGNMPAARFLGMGYSLSTAAFTAYTAAACFNGVARVNSNLTYNTIHNKTNNNFPSPLDLYNAQMVIGDGSSSGYAFVGYGQTFDASLPLSIWTYQAASGGSYTFYYNGSSTASGSVGQYGDNGNPFVLGSRADGVTGLDGWISESITFKAIPSATDRQFLEWSQAQYYAISGFSLSTVPVSAASASVSIWYDQSGNGRNAVQATAANQPRLVNAGSIEKNNSYPCMRFSGSPQNIIAPLSASVYPVSISLLANTSGSTSNGAFVKLGTNVNGGAAGIGIGIGNSGGSLDNTGTSVVAVKEFVASCPSSPNVNYPSTLFASTTIQQSGSGGMTSYLNGTAVPLSNASSSVGASITGSLFIGGYTNTLSRYPIVKETEVVVFGSALSNTRRLLIEANQAALNGITTAANKYAPPAASSYQRFVNGVGRESATDSVAGTRSTVGMGISVVTSTAGFLKDNGDYMTYGTNCALSGGTSTLNLPGTVTQRWASDWYLNKTDVSSNSGSVTVFFDFSDYGLSLLPGTASNYELLARNTSSGTFSIVTGTTKSVTGDRVLFALDAASISNAFYYTIGTQNTNASPLPIELLTFDLTCNINKVDISWSTATEKNNSFFSIERSADGKEHEIIGIVNGAGNSTQKKNYSFQDDRPLPGIAYYRLKQTDYDNAERSYKYKQLLCAANNEGVKIYPNPTTGSFVLEGVKLFSDITIFDATGRAIFQKSNLLNKEEIDVAYLHDGIYFVAISDGSQKTNVKLVIQH